MNVNASCRYYFDHTRKGIVSLKMESIETSERTKSYMVRHIVRDSWQRRGGGRALLHTIEGRLRDTKYRPLPLCSQRKHVAEQTFDAQRAPPFSAAFLIGNEM